MEGGEIFSKLLAKSLIYEAFNEI